MTYSIPCTRVRAASHPLTLTHMILSAVIGLMRMVMGGAMDLRVWRARILPVIRQCLFCVCVCVCVCVLKPKCTTLSTTVSLLMVHTPVTLNSMCTLQVKQ